MKLFTQNIQNQDPIKLAPSDRRYSKKVIFHCYWSGALNKLHFLSIFSCYYFNVFQNKNFKIILWVNNSKNNYYYRKIKKFAEVIEFDFESEIRNTVFEKEKKFKVQKKLTHQANLIRSILLYNYGGCWFDLDIFFLRSFEPLFDEFEKDICLYQWESKNYPNNAIYISLEPKSSNFEKNIEYIINLKKGWGFQQANLTFDMPLSFLVLPCSWFDPDWIKKDNEKKWDSFFQNTRKEINFNNFHQGSFSYHWHNRWNYKPKKNSPIIQLHNHIWKAYNDKINE